jgi:hypothetical protein
MAFNLFEAPEYYQGLLGEDATKKLQNKALTTGLVNAAIGYLAQPKTGGYGSALPYIGRALAGGLQAGQETIRSGLTDYETQQKIAEMRKKKEQEAAQEQAISQLPANMQQAYRAFGAAAVPSIVKSQFPETESQFAKINILDATPESVAEYKATGDITKLRKVKENKAPTYTDAYKNISITKFNTDNPADLTPEQRIEVDNEVRKRGLERPPQSQTVIMTPRQIFQDEQALRKEYSAIPEVKLFGEVQNSYDTIKTALSKQSPAGDLAGATKFMKLLDPGSVVRESELGLAMAATGALDRAQNYYNMLKTGQKLNPTQRKDFLDLSTQLYQAAEGRKSSYDQQYGSIAEQNQLSPSNVVKGFKKQGEWSIKEKK